jgi:transcriptional regulator with XRE-family HTH domain
LPDFRHRVGARIAARRQEAGLTQTQLGRRLPGEPGEGQISRWERGESFPSYRYLTALARVFGISEEALLLGPEEERPARRRAR